MTPADAILALVAAGEGAVQVKAATHWLEHHFSTYVSAKGVDNPGARRARDPRGGSGRCEPGELRRRNERELDLVARLRATEHLNGPAAGIFGAKSSANAFSQSLALLALVAAEARRWRPDSVRPIWRVASVQTAVGVLPHNPLRQAGPEDLLRSRHELNGAGDHGDRRSRRAFPHQARSLSSASHRRPTGPSAITAYRAMVNGVTWTRLAKSSRHWSRCERSTTKASSVTQSRRSKLSRTSSTAAQRRRASARRVRLQRCPQSLRDAPGGPGGRRSGAAHKAAQAFCRGVQFQLWCRLTRLRRAVAPVPI